MTDLSDEQLLNDYFSGDLEAFSIFYKRHSTRVLAYGMRKGLSQDHAADACQEAFFKLHKSIHTYAHGRPALPWFFAIVHHCVIDMKRSTLRDLKVGCALEGELSHTPKDHTLAPNGNDPFYVLSRLPETQQYVVKMRALEERSFRELSQITGRSQVSLRKLFERARNKLKAAFLEDQSDAV